MVLAPMAQISNERVFWKKKLEDKKKHAPREAAIIMLRSVTDICIGIGEGEGWRKINRIFSSDMILEDWLLPGVCWKVLAHISGCCDCWLLRLGIGAKHWAMLLHNIETI